MTVMKRKRPEGLPMVSRKKKRMPSLPDLNHWEEQREMAAKLEQKAGLSASEGRKMDPSELKEQLAYFGGMTSRKFEELYRCEKKGDRVRKSLKYPPLSLQDGVAYKLEPSCKAGQSVAELLHEMLSGSTGFIGEAMKTIKVDPRENALVVDYALSASEQPLEDATKGCNFEGRPFPEVVFLVGRSRTLEELRDEAGRCFDANHSTVKQAVVLKHFVRTGEMVAVVYRRVKEEVGDGEESFYLAAAVSFGTTQLEEGVIDQLKQEDKLDIQLSGGITATIDLEKVSEVFLRDAN